MQIFGQLVKFLHILAVVFMAWPLYVLIAVNERGRLGSPLGSDADRYMENIINSQTIRCYVFQLTALVTGFLLVYLYGMGLKSILTNWVLAAKTGLFVTMVGLFSYVPTSILASSHGSIHFLRRLKKLKRAHPFRNRSLLRSAPRVRRKRLAGMCLFLVITAIILGLQVFARFNPILLGVLIALAGLFAWQAYRRPIRYGWL